MYNFKNLFKITQKKKLNSSSSFFFKETFLATLALLSCAIFLYLASKVSELPGTVTNGDFNSDAYIAIFQQTWLIAIEFTISVIFTVDYFWNFLLHQYK